MKTLSITSEFSREEIRQSKISFVLGVGLLTATLVFMLVRPGAVFPIVNNFLLMGHISLLTPAAPYIGRLSVKKLGPAVVPLLWPQVAIGMLGIYTGAWVMVVYYFFFPSPYLAIPVIVLVVGGLLWSFFAYRRARRRTKENYHEILRILGLPDV